MYIDYLKIKQYYNELVSFDYKTYLMLTVLPMTLIYSRISSKSKNDLRKLLMTHCRIRVLINNEKMLNIFVIIKSNLLKLEPEVVTYISNKSLFFSGL